MKTYKYEALDSNGNILRGYLDAENEEEASGFLISKDLYIISLKERLKIPKFLLYIRQRITNADLIQFARNLSVMLRAGIGITDALSEIAHGITKERFKKIVEDVKDLVEKGIRLSEAMERYKEVFPPIFRSLIRIGEETGRLDKSLDDIVSHFQRIEELRAAIKRALIYPIFAMIVSTGAMIFWILYVVPKIVLAMKGLGIKIPLVTSFLLEAGTLGRKYIYILPLLIIFALFASPLIKKSEKIRKIKSYLSFELPVMKVIFYNRAIALFSEQMRILFGAGIPVDSAFEMAENVMDNEIMKRAIMNARGRISKGERISPSLREERIFPSLVIRLVDVGESTGTLEEQFGFLSNYYTRYLQEYSERLGKIIEPVMISIIGIFFAIILISLLSPVYELVSKLGAG